MAVILSSAVEATARASGLIPTIPLVAEEVADATDRARRGRRTVGTWQRFDRSPHRTTRSPEVRFALLTVRRDPT